VSARGREERLTPGRRNGNACEAMRLERMAHENSHEAVRTLHALSWLCLFSSGWFS
jgi:hypothetical protein